LARLPYADPAAAPEKARAIFEALPVKLNLFRMLLHAPGALRGYLTLGTGILARQKLDPRIRELAILRVAALSPAEYERTQHVPIAKACGATDAEIDAVAKGDLASLDPRAGIALRFADACLREVRVPDALFEEARGAFSPQEIVELVMTVGYYMMTARLLETLGVDLEPPAAGMASQFGSKTR
jgi:alkylhydroperoxidase family enzyme